MSEHKDDYKEVIDEDTGKTQVNFQAARQAYNQLKARAEALVCPN